MNWDMSVPYVLSTVDAIHALELLFALSAGIQTLEYWRMRPALQSRGLWTWQIQGQDIPHAVARKFFDFLFHRLAFFFIYRNFI